MIMYAVVVTFLLLTVATNSFKIFDFSDEPSTTTTMQANRNGQYAIRNQFPYMVSLYMHPSNAFCGGALITASTVITAAHCIKQNVTIGNWTSVVFGSLILDKYPPEEPFQIIQTATGVLWHPEFTSNILTDVNDIGLVFFDAVPLSSAIAVIALPTDASNDYVDADVVLTGYK